MFKSLAICILLSVVTCVKGLPQSLTRPANSTYSYHPPSADKESWQRLNLWLSASYFRTTTRGISLDSALIHVSHSLGLSRLPLIAEGIDDPNLLAQSKWFDQGDPGKGIHLLSQATGKKRLQLMLLLGAYYAFKPTYHRKYRDSVEYFLRKAIDESKIASETGLGRFALCLLAKVYVQAGLDTGNVVFSQLINECETAGDKKTKAKALTYRGLYTLYKPSDLNAQTTVADLMQRRIGYLENAREIYHELNDKEGGISVLSNIGYHYLVLSRFEEAYTAFIKALQLENAIGYPYTHYTADGIVMLTMAQGKFGEPLKYSLEAVKTAEVTRDSIGWANFYARLGELYYTEGGRAEESLKWMLKALDRYVITNDGSLYQNLYGIVKLMHEGHREQEALDLVLRISKKVPPVDPNDSVFHRLTFALGYMGAKQYALAEQNIVAADSIQRIFQVSSHYVSLNSSYERTMINNSYGSLYFAKGQFAKSKKYLEEYLADSSRAVALETDISVYKQLIQIDSIFHDAASGVNHYKLYTQLLDSNFRVSKVRQAEELQVMYQTKEKEDQIALLNQQAKLEQTNLKHATLVKNLTIAGIVAVLIIAGLLYRQNRLKQKSNSVITHKNEQLQHLLVEKEWLLKEIHHRVKNNLQTIMGLLGTQSGYLKNDIAINAITDSRRRIQAMSLIHQRLYQTDNLSAIRMTDYIRELVDFLSEGFNIGNRIRFNQEIDPIELDLAHCIPLGLILNEAITNSFKYAFPNNARGTINISVTRNSKHQLSLRIQDDGAGLPPGLNVAKSDSMGMNLMRGLSAEIGADFSISSQNGTRIDINLLYDPEVEMKITRIKTEATPVA